MFVITSIMRHFLEVLICFRTTRDNPSQDSAGISHTEMYFSKVCGIVQVAIANISLRSNLLNNYRKQIRFLHTPIMIHCKQYIDKAHNTLDN